MKPKIRLYDSGLGLVIEQRTGVVYSNQTMGHICMQPEVEGVFVPFDAEGARKRLADYFEGPKYVGSGAMHGLDEEDAAFIETVLRDARIEGDLIVDRTRLGESHEAWVHVLVQSEPEPPALFCGFGPYPRRAVLTWPNSD